MKIIAIMLGAALGATGRYLLTTWATARWGPSFPFGTGIINVSGSFLIGVVMIFALIRFPHSDVFRLFWVTGILGGFTTFSSFSYEAMTLIEAGRWQLAVVYLSGSVLLGLAGVFLGAFLARALLAS
ncbi:MAG: fluoride efflux transporter CrcB [Candidatus Eremiobacteraeota bacterium]|nr:fluoride efflux transporter CrcB [Candidatus Eremiobacteraeota bacterium]MCW5871558.1 fluoride efflux transporter CrcB [Candidatus Eremiobacteraeota bacterium]